MATNSPAAPQRSPDPLHPLAEPTKGRRIWAFYMQRGYTRTTFAKAIGCAYSMVLHWESGTHEPSLPLLIKIAVLFNVSLDDLVFGAEGRPKSTQLPPNDAIIMDTLDRMGASPRARAAFGKHQSSDAGRYQRFTFEYVHRFATAFDAAIAKGATDAAAAGTAFAEAINARAVAAGAITESASGVQTPSRTPGSSTPARARKRATNRDVSSR